MVEFVAIFFSYLLGSFPTALVVSRRMYGVDIRTLGDGNMGARNTFRTLGMVPGLIVALGDGIKGMMAVLFTQRLGLDPLWQCAAGGAAIAGHDFPIFAGFRGGQGFAVTMGSLFVLFPEQAAPGLLLYAMLYLVTRNSDVSAGTGCAAMLWLLWFNDRPVVFMVYMVTVLLFIPVKKALDAHRIQPVETLQHRHIHR
jgi:glycerol-3-phosphate acyltransferase PlsY